MWPRLSDYTFQRVLVAENAPDAAKTPRFDSFFRRKNNTQGPSATESTAEARAGAIGAAGTAMAAPLFQEK